ncbi:unnamed protein product [Schistocephalus solidus]|uniref:G-protein alpha subunit n=1 Tax=Schistocephalus solidus TaxID=70667 RepID=A0A183SZA6_SCHSO|nr:unnamed protein product [Schistocephalus solidus]
MTAEFTTMSTTPSTPTIITATATTTSTNKNPRAPSDFSCPYYTGIFTSRICLLVHLRIHRTEAGKPARSTLKIPWAGGPNCDAANAADALENHFKTFQRTQRERARLRQVLWMEDEFLQIAPLLAKIWADDSIRLAFDQRSRLITEDFNYVPTNEDIVWSRRPTNSIIEEEICVHGIPITFIDVGGQTKERSKWCHAFTDMTSVLFLVACSHYDEFYVDRVTEEYRNKLREAMDVFESLINHVSFRRVSIILFFNKTDILKEKLASGLSSIRSSFPEFPSEADERKLADVQNFLVTLFSSRIDPNPDPTLPEEGEAIQRLSGLQKLFHSKSLSRHDSGSNASSQGFDRTPRRRTVYRHFTTAVDRRNIETVFNAMQDTILQSNLRRLMMS